MSDPALPAGFRVITASARRRRAGWGPGSRVDMLLDASLEQVA